MRQVVVAEAKLVRDLQSELAREQLAVEPVRAGRLASRIVEVPGRGLELAAVFLDVERDPVDVVQAQAMFLQAAADRPPGKEVGVLDPVQALLLDGGDDLAVAQQHGRAVVASDLIRVVFHFAGAVAVDSQDQHDAPRRDAHPSMH